MAAAPLFADVQGSSFEPWMLHGLDRLFAADARIEKVFFDLWASYYYDDNSNYDFKGDASFRFRPKADGKGEDGMTEEELDEIPAVRMLERRAVELWHDLPLTIDDEGNLNGEFGFHAERGLIEFEYTTSQVDETIFRIVVRHDGEKWIVEETISIPMPDGATMVDIAANDYKEVYLQNFDPDDYQLRKHPEVISMEVGEDDDSLVFHVVPGALASDTDPDE